MDNKKTCDLPDLEPCSLSEVIPDPNSIDQTALRTKNIADFARFSFELEEKREQSLISQSGQMLTVFSVVSAALLMAVPILIDYTCVPKNKILIAAGIVLTFLLASMVLAVLSQWRFKYATMLNGEELLQKVEKDINNHIYQSQFDYQWIDQLTDIQTSKKKNNDKRYMLVHASMITFLTAIGLLFACSLILVLS